MFESGLLKKKSIIVTGGGTGLGKSMATRYAELGADLVITSRRQEVINSTAEELREYGGKVLAVSCDVRDPDQVQNMVDQTVNEFGKLTFYSIMQQGIL
jgi:NAD(P)-dependent dehydrogenase (short-subunit alcohol dehydrogenase family)